MGASSGESVAHGRPLAWGLALVLAATPLLAQAAGWTVGPGSTLTVAGALGGDVVVASGGTLAGEGSIAGNVDVADGGIIAPGSPVGILTVTGSVTLANDSVLNFDLGAGSDRIQVDGNLMLDGILNVAAQAGFGVGTYRLFDYTGSLTNNALALGSMPSGYHPTIDISIAGQVNLVVAAAGPGPGPEPEPGVQGPGAGAVVAIPTLSEWGLLLLSLLLAGLGRGAVGTRTASERQ